MAGTVRQPIDIQSLERYISQQVPEIKTPIELKQVTIFPTSVQCIELILLNYSSDLANQTPLTR